MELIVVLSDPLSLPVKCQSDLMLVMCTVVTLMRVTHHIAQPVAEVLAELTENWP